MRNVLLSAMFLVTTAVTLPAQESPAADAAAIEVARALVATGVEDREPLGAAESFPENVETVYFYTELRGDFGEAEVEHVWLRDGEEVTRLPLNVRGPRWRVWTSKRIPADWAGRWTARIVDANGAVLESVDFTVGEQD